MPHELVDLEIEEVSGVDAAANKRTFLIVKRVEEAKQDVSKGDEGDDSPPLTTLGRLQRQQLWSQWYPLWGAFCDSVHEILDGDADDIQYGPLLLRSITEFQSEAARILTSLGLVGKATSLFAAFDDLEKIGAVISAGRKKRLQDAISTLQAILDEAAPKASNDPPTEKGDPMPTAEQEALAKAVLRAETAEASVTTLQKQLADKTAALDEIQKAQDANDPEAMWKGVPEGIRKRQEALEKRLQEADEKSERLEYIEKSKELRHVGMVPDDDWETLRAINKMDAKPKARLLQLLKSANEVIKASSLWKPMGHDQLSEGASAEDRAMALAKSFVADGKAKDVSDGLDQVFKADGNLYAEYQHESRQRSRVK